MHSALLQELVEVRRRDTEVCAPALRKKHPARRPTQPPEVEPPAAVDPDEIPGLFVDPGDTLARAPAPRLLVREALVRRNHRARRRPAFVPDPRAQLEIAWVRSRDPGLVVARIGPDTIQVEGVVRTGGPRALALGIDHLIFTIPLAAGEAAAVAARRLKRRLLNAYIAEIVERSADLCLVRLRSHT